MEDKRSRLLSFFLCLFLGTMGVHRFYLRKTKTGLLMLLTLGGFGFWYITDLILIASGRLQRKEKQVLSPAKN